MVTSVSTTAGTANTSTSSGGKAVTDMTAMQDRFLTLLVAQINHQDPLNPMDNAQMTSQMAQINTVNGIQQVNQTLQSMAAQLASMQALQGTSLVGREVLTAGNTLYGDAATGMATGVIDLAGRADAVKVDVLNPNGQLLDSFNLGAQDAGRVSFQWNTASYQGSGDPVFRVSATRYKQPVTSTSLTQDKVQSVGTVNGALSLQLQGGAKVAYGDIVSIL